MTREELSLLSLFGYVFLQNARPDKAAAILAALDNLAPGQTKVLRALALAQIRCGKAELSLDTLERLALSGCSDAAFHLLRGQALAMLDLHEEASRAMTLYMQMRSIISTTHTPGSNGE